MCSQWTHCVHSVVSTMDILCTCYGQYYGHTQYMLRSVQWTHSVHSVVNTVDTLCTCCGQYSGHILLAIVSTVDTVYILWSVFWKWNLIRAHTFAKILLKFNSTEKTSYICKYLKFFIYLFLYVYMYFWMILWVPYEYRSLQSWEEGFLSPGIGISGSCELPCGCWVLNRALSKISMHS